MNKLQQVFARDKAFIPFITAGDPALEVTEQLVLQMAAAGADLIELGIPFSDPIAEGPVIQAADSRALAGGVTIDKIFAMIKRIRTSCSIPLVVMTYINPVFAYSSDRFIKNCLDVDIAGVIIPDLPFEEQEELLPHCRKYNVNLISMVAPTSANRIRMIAASAQGFIYCVSSLGVTGVRREIGNEAGELVKEIKKSRDIPCAIGFGISTPAQAAKMSLIADGVIVGSAIVKIIEQHGKDCVAYVTEYVRTMKKAVTESKT